MRSNRGFTLIELMIVAVVIAIIAAVALPAYNEQTRKSRRSEARSGIQQLALGQERWRANNPSYTSTVSEAGGAPQATYYTFALSNATATTYTITATPAGSQASDTECGTFSYAFNAGTVSKSPTTDGCW